MNIVKQVGKVTSRYPEDSIMRAIQTNTSLISKLLTMERVSLYTLKENWGGGFEMAYYNGTRFEKLDKIAYVINQQYNVKLKMSSRRIGSRVSWVLFLRQTVLISVALGRI